MYKILKGYIDSSKNTKQRKNDCEYLFQVKYLIKLYSNPCHDKDNGYHLERHPRISAKIL
jgi:hypothetical protein